MVIRTGPKRKKPQERKKPQAGDKKTVKGVEYVRRQARSKDGAYYVSNGRPVWEWVRV